MLELTSAQQSAIGAVAKRFGAVWRTGDDPPDAYANVRGRLIALDVAVIAQKTRRRRPAANVRLREDVVARRVLREIESSVQSHVPKHKTIILTLGAPLKVPKKLIAALTTLLLDYIRSGADEREEKRTVLGNRVRFLVLNSSPGWKAKLVGFVFSGDPQPGALGDTLRSLYDQIAAQQKRRMPKGFAGERWLVLNGETRIADIKTYRLAVSHLSPSALRGFKKIFMVFDGGEVESLTGA